MFFKMKALFNFHIPKVHYSLQIIQFYAIIFNLLYFIQLSHANCTLSQPSLKQTEDVYLRTLLPLQDISFETKDEKYKYKIRICNPADEKVNPAAGAIQYQLQSEKNNYILGKFDSVEVMGGTDWILLIYNNGEPYTNHCNSTTRVAMIMIVCDPFRFVGDLRILEERTVSADDNCFYLFELGSNVVCNNVSSGLSSGGVFCIIFFTIAGIYLLIGFLYQRIVVGAKGLEQIPNYTFWRSFGNLQADGCDYICRCGPRQESQAYRGIDDRIRTDEERDDQLLNM